MIRGVGIALALALSASSVVVAAQVAGDVTVRKGTELLDALTAVVDVAGMSLVVDPSAKDAVGRGATIEIEKAPWPAALKDLMTAHALEAEISGNVIRVLGQDDPCPASGLTKDQPGFTGRPLSLSFKDGTTIDILRFICDFGGLDVVLDAAEPGLHTRSRLHLTEVPWDQALDLILREACLTGVIEGKVIRISGARPRPDQS